MRNAPGVLLFGTLALVALAVAAPLLGFRPLKDLDFLSGGPRGGLIQNETLEDVEIERCHVVHSVLRDVEARKCTFQDVEMTGGLAAEAKARNLTAIDVQFWGGEISHGRIERGSAHDADFAESELRWTRLKGVDVLRGLVEDSRGERVRLKHSILRNSTMSWGSLREARCENSTLAGFRMDNSTWSGCTVSGTEATKIFLGNVTAKGGRVAHAVLHKGAYDGTVLVDVKIEGADVSRAKRG